MLLAHRGSCLDPSAAASRHGILSAFFRRYSIDMIGLVPELTEFVPPAKILDKHVYSPWTGTDLHQQLRGAGVDTIIITGGETDVCVLATMLGAIDWGFRTILVTDALCSSADETHDAMMDVCMKRFAQWRIGSEH
jgi:nicotinamidase-related amidase